MNSEQQPGKILPFLKDLIGMAEDGYKLHRSNACQQEFLEEDREVLRKAKEWLEDLSAPASPVEEKREEFTTIKRAVGDIFWKHISMSKDGKAIEGNPAVHRIAEYIVANFQPLPPSPVIEIGEQKQGTLEDKPADCMRCSFWGVTSDFIDHCKHEQGRYLPEPENGTIPVPDWCPLNSIKEKVYFREECVFNYCPNSDGCKGLNKCQSPAETPASHPAPALIVGETPFGLSESDIQTILGRCLKAEEISGEGSVQIDRVRELVCWFLRYATGSANPKWFHAHAYELVYYIATNSGNRSIDLDAVRQTAYYQGVNITPGERSLLSKMGLIPAADSAPTEQALPEEVGQIKDLKATIQTYNELNARLLDELRTANARIKELQEWHDSHA
jgi:hypothetical protein